MDDEESLGTGVEKKREKVVKLPKTITCAKGGGKCGDASGALCAQCCHVPDLFSRASEFLHTYCVRWALGGSHGVAPA